MDEQVIICPHCKKEIPLTKAIFDSIREKFREEFESVSKEKEKELVQKEQVLSAREKKIEESRKLVEEEVSRKVKVEKGRLEKEAKQKAEEAAAAEIKYLHEQVEERQRKLQEAQKLELELRKERRKLEDSKKAFELETARKLDEEREKIKNSAVESLMEEHKFKDREKEELIGGMKKQIEELRRKAEQGSQQTQGEVLELELEGILKANFPLDHIEPVPKGIKGADVLQKVHNQTGQYCGTIVWEAKRTKMWSDGWISKLKDDQREVKAEIAALMTTVLPKDLSNFGLVNGVWVTDHASLVGVATVLRVSLVQVASTKLATVGTKEKMQVLYDYLCGPQFGQRVEAIVEAFGSMKKELDQEKMAMGRMWSKREKEIERVVTNTVGMYGDMQGIIGASLPEIKSLEFTEK